MFCDEGVESDPKRLWRFSFSVSMEGATNTYSRFLIALVTTSARFLLGDFFSAAADYSWLFTPLPTALIISKSLTSSHSKGNLHPSAIPLSASCTSDASPMKPKCSSSSLEQRHVSMETTMATCCSEKILV